uniref:SAM domain-containing protein n=1 Tax=Clastoptera arizonana TaxID=38151 RepID=A0A1B6DKN9_9HEMI
MRPYKGSDNMSQISNGTNTSGKGSDYSCREDLQELADLLGLTSVAEIYQERFRVDRRKLENMIKGEDEGTVTANDFFQKVMDDTSTRISWPSRLKIGAKSKKDPHIRIAGRNVDVKIAKSKIISILDTRSNRVTMKLDVSYTDHSHIIGRGGLSIKGVMEDTGCHIHFPDSNRNNPVEKSNQVSIAGDIQGVEKARARVRELMPLIFSFELPVVSSVMSLPDSTSPYILSIQESYNVQVMFRTRPKFHSTLVLVKGCEWEVDNVKEATQLLITNMCENLASQISVHMMMEISPQHHQVVLGHANENLKAIINYTNTQILFPDAYDPNTPSLKKSSVTITGSIQNVYLARQLLMGSLPLILIFDVPEEAISIDKEQINELMTSLDVFISIRNKIKQNVISVIIKGIERDASKIYEAREKLLGSKESDIVVDIPSTYFMQNTSKSVFGSTTGNHFGFHSPNFPIIKNSAPNIFIPHVLQPTVLMNSNNEGNNFWPLSQPYQGNQYLLHQLLPKVQRVNGLTDRNSLGQFSLSMPEITGGYSSLSSNTSPLSSPSTSPRNASPVQKVTREQNYIETKSQFDLTDVRAPGFERHMRNNHDYQYLKVQAAQAVQTQPKPTDIRVPTSNWSGYGFSQSSPISVLKELKKKEGIKSHNGGGREGWNETPVFSAAVTDCSDSSDIISNDHREVALSASNYLDCMPLSTLKTITNSQTDSLATLFTSLGLERYIQLFKEDEIDLETFQTLNESDLKEIGVSAFGARRKMLLSISELNKRPVSPFFGSAAPGAERKNLSLNNLNEVNW